MQDFRSTSKNTGVCDRRRRDVFRMDPLLKKVIFRFFVFLSCIFFSAWLLFIAEHTEKDIVEEKYQLLLSLYGLMASKCNMTIEEFNNFSSLALEALSEPKPRWTYLAAVDFVFQAFTTIGKSIYTEVQQRYKKRQSAQSLRVLPNHSRIEVHILFGLLSEHMYDSRHKNKKTRKTKRNTTKHNNL